MIYLAFYKHYELLLGQEITAIFEKYRRLCSEYEDVSTKLKLTLPVYLKKDEQMPPAIDSLGNRAKLVGLLEIIKTQNILLAFIFELNSAI